MLRHVITHLRRQDWTAVVIELIVWSTFAPSRRRSHDVVILQQRRKACVELKRRIDAEIAAP